jgi:hypothetical protein
LGNDKVAKRSQGFHELKKYKILFEEWYSELLFQETQAKLLWLQHQSEINTDNLNDVRHEDIPEKRLYFLKNKIYVLVTNKKNKDIRDPHRGTNEREATHLEVSQ